MALPPMNGCLRGMTIAHGDNARIPRKASSIPLYPALVATPIE